MLKTFADAGEFAARIQDFLKQGKVKQDLEKMFQEQEKFQKLVVDIDVLRETSPDLSEACIHYPIQMTKMFEEGVELIKSHQFYDQTETDIKNWRISFEGNLGDHTVTPRGLKSKLINSLVKLQGIVVSTSKVRHRLLKSTHFCDATSNFSTYMYHDGLNLRQNRPDRAEFLSKMPLYDEKNNPLTFEFGLSEYKDIQIVTLQEMPENIPTGHMSRSIEVIVQEDTVDAMKPGDRVQITGIFRPIVSSNTILSGNFRSCVMATSVILLTSVGDDSVSGKEIKSIRRIAQRPDLLQLLIRSIAPSIFGHEQIKEGLLMQLLGGSEKVFDEAMRLRGDINILLVGDPSTGKSQFLRRIMTIANLSFSTTGRGSTGVGLTAAITMDKDTNEKHLEAGAMVLADRGIICVDEFDKMSIEDRVAMHEVMEQQTVTIAKAGIHVSLNARCSVLAAANPRYGEYEDKRNVDVNINMPPSLLSRFDLIFIVRDHKDPEIDREISKRVTKNHRFEGATSNLISNNDMSGLVPQEIFHKKIEIVEEFEQYNKFLHEDKNVQYMNVNFLKKYVIYAKALKPELTESANDLICRKWTRLRFLDVQYGKNSGNRIIVQTIRSLESLIRLSTAFAKMRISKTVDLIDVFRAFQLFNRAFYGGTDKIDPTFWVEEKEQLELLKERDVHIAIFNKHEKNVEKANRDYGAKNETNHKRVIETGHKNQNLNIQVFDSNESKDVNNDDREVLRAPENNNNTILERSKKIHNFYAKQVSKGNNRGIEIAKLYEMMKASERIADTFEEFKKALNYLKRTGKIEVANGIAFPM